MGSIVVFLMPLLFLGVGLFARRYTIATRLLVICIIVPLLLALYIWQ